jgi:hypothetical protein
MADNRRLSGLRQMTLFAGADRRLATAALRYRLQRTHQGKNHKKLLANHFPTFICAFNQNLPGDGA